MRRNNGVDGSDTMRILNLIQRRWLAPLKRNDDVRDSDVRTYTRHRSYKKLPQLAALKLSILKLDGSVFEICVRRTATIAELKQAVEEVFGSLQGKTPWSLVWGNFCLCHVGQKLTNDKACIRKFGIKDGDQLQFIRHMSISNSPLKKQSKRQTVPYKKLAMLTDGSNEHDKEEGNGLEGFDNNGVEEDNSKYSPNEFKVVHYLKGWLSYSKVNRGSKRGIRNMTRAYLRTKKGLGAKPLGEPTTPPVTKRELIVLPRKNKEQEKDCKGQTHPGSISEIYSIVKRELIFENSS